MTQAEKQVFDSLQTNLTHTQARIEAAKYQIAFEEEKLAKNRAYFFIIKTRQLKRFIRFHKKYFDSSK